MHKDQIKKISWDWCSTQGTQYLKIDLMLFLNNNKPKLQKSFIMLQIN